MAGTPRLLLGAAMCAAVAATGWDLVSDEHPTHVMVLGLVVAVVVSACRWMRWSGATALPAVAAALAAQPALHILSTMDRSGVEPHDHGNVLHVVMSEVPAATVQVLVPVLVLVAVGIGVRLLRLVVTAICRPLGLPPLAATDRLSVLMPARSLPLGSMLHWCGWAIRAARRGPPSDLAHGPS